MVNILKNWMGIKKDDNLKDIPEIHLHKKEPKFYFDEKLKRWVIEGEEIEPEKAKKPPPKKVMITKDKNDKNKAKNKTKSKYANAFGDENIYTPEIKPKVENEEKNDINNINNDVNELNNNIVEEKKDEINIEEVKKEESDKKPELNEKDDINIENNLQLDNINNIENNIENKENNKNENSPLKENIEMTSNSIINFKQLTSIKKFDTRSELSEMSLHKEDFTSLYQKELNDYKKNILEEEISKIKEQYNQNLKQKEVEYESQINELKEINQFTEETYNENISELKKQKNDYIKENLNLKSNLEKLTDEVEYSKKQIQEYQNLVEHYKKLLKENENNKNEILLN